MESGEQAVFVERDRCVACGCSRIEDLARGRFTDEPLRGYIAADPWGECPLSCLTQAEWVFSRCLECQLKFHRRILDPEWNERRFSRWMTKEAIVDFERERASFEGSFRAGVDHVGHALRIEMLTRAERGRSNPVRVLDFGCGWGKFVLTCQMLGFDACGVDRSEARSSGGSVKMHSSLGDIPQGTKYDAITAFEVLEHLDDPRGIVIELAKLLRFGGVLVAETPDCEGVAGIRTLREYRLIHPLEHLNAFTYQTLRSMIECCGFQLIDRGAAYVTAELARVGRASAKYLLGRGEKSTQLYFRKTN